MTFSDFVLDAFFQSLILADIGLAISLILRRQKTTVAFFASKIVFSSSLGISTFVFVTVLAWIFNKAAPLNGGSRFFHTRPLRMTQIDAPKIQV